MGGGGGAGVADTHCLPHHHHLFLLLLLRWRIRHTSSSLERLVPILDAYHPGVVRGLVHLVEFALCFDELSDGVQFDGVQFDTSSPRRFRLAF